MKVMLINPYTGDSNLIQFVYPPMGLLAVAGYIRQQGIDVALQDFNVTKLKGWGKRKQLTAEEQQEIICGEAPDVVGITALTVNIKKAWKTAEIVKRIDKDITVALGGPHAIVAPQHALQDSNIDYVFSSEGEIAFMRLLECLADGRDPYDIPSMGYRRPDGNVTVNPREDFIRDLDALPIPAYDLLDAHKYVSPYTARKPFMTMVRSRGCPYQCVYCDIPETQGRGYRVQTPQRTLEEVDYLANVIGIKEIGFKDSVFTINKKNIHEFCDLMIERNYDLEWTINATVNTVNKDLLDKMRAAGCRSVTYGVETGNEEIMKNFLKKGTKLQQARDAVFFSKNAGMNVTTNFMIGNPGDTKETIEETIDFAIELDADYAAFSNTTPLPGTQLYEMAKEEGWLLENGGTEELHFENISMNATDLPYEELIKYLNRAYRRFYLRPIYILRRLWPSLCSFNEMRNSWYGVSGILVDTVMRYLGKAEKAPHSRMSDHTANTEPPEPSQIENGEGLLMPTFEEKTVQDQDLLLLESSGSRQQHLRKPTSSKAISK